MLESSVGPHVDHTISFGAIVIGAFPPVPAHGAIADVGLPAIDTAIDDMNVAGEEQANIVRFNELGNLVHVTMHVRVGHIPEALFQPLSIKIDADADNGQ